MRIIHILLGKANPNTLNGVNKAVHQMATSQEQLGHQVEVWGLSASMKVPNHPRSYRLRIFPLTRLRVTLGREIRSAISRLEAGTWVQFHSVYIPEFPVIAGLLKRQGLCYGVTPHSGYAPGVFKKNPWKKRLYVALREARFLRSAALIQAVGASEVQDILRIAPGARVVLIPNGQEPLCARREVVPDQAVRPRIGFCGRLATQHKGLDYLIEGFAGYKAKGGAGELWLIGDGEDRGALEEKAAESGVGPSVRFLGARHGAEKLDLVVGFDVFIHSSRWEGLPMSCLEAAALGRPLVVSRETNFAEYVEKCGGGLVLDECSAAGVARALEQVDRLYQNHQLEPMGKNAQLLIEREFNWEENARRFVVAAESAMPALQ
ncbi:MAG: glycosyltransferase family 4 protein [Terracidiphilus sp.]